MRIIAAPAFAAWIVTSAFSLSANDLSGTIKNIDIPMRQVVLDDGNAYSVRRGINLAKFTVGERVTLHTEDENGKTMVTKLTKGEYVLRDPNRLPAGGDFFKRIINSHRHGQSARS